MLMGGQGIESLVSKSIFKLDLQIQCFGNHILRDSLVKTFSFICTLIPWSLGSFNLEETKVWKEAAHCPLDYPAGRGFEGQHKSCVMYIDF